MQHSLLRRTATHNWHARPFGRTERTWRLTTILGGFVLGLVALAFIAWAVGAAMEAML